MSSPYVKDVNDSCYKYDTNKRSFKEAIQKQSLINQRVIMDALSFLLNPEPKDVSTYKGPKRDELLEALSMTADGTDRVLYDMDSNRNTPL